MDEGMHDPRLSAEGELALMRLALDDGELEHAAGHLAGAVGYAPDLPEVHEALAGLVAELGAEALDLFPLDGEVYIGTVVARAHVLAALDRPAEAIGLVAAASAQQPEVPWADVAWLDAPELAGRLDPEVLTDTFATLSRGMADPVPADERAPLLPYLRLAQHAVVAHPRAGIMLAAASAVGRRLGAAEQAVAWARAGVETEPSKITEVWLGYAYRSVGRYADAVAAWQRALRYDPKDFALYADIATVLAQAGRIDEAISWTERALDVDPTYDCAVHTGARLRFQRDRDVAHLVGLADFVRTHPDESHQHNDLAEACRDVEWLGHLAVPSESSTNVLAQIMESEADLAHGSLTITGMEPPSALATVARCIPGLEITITEVAEPDLRVPLRAGTVALWRFDGTNPVPVPAPAAPDSAERVKHLATYWFPDPPTAYDRAVALAAVPLDDLVALLVHPPEPPDGSPMSKHPAIWAKAVQTWACLGLLHHRADEPWETSTRRRVLLDIAWGVEDWSTETALFAMVVTAWVDPTARTDVAHQVADRLRIAASAYRKRPVTIVHNLAALALATPDLPRDAHAMARRLTKDEPARSPQKPRRGLLNRLRGRR